MPQRSQRAQEREFKKELKQKKQRLKQIQKQRASYKEYATEEMLQLENRIRHLQDWLANTNR